MSERQWGTVREDYSEDGNAWNYFTHDQARSRAYKWGEDGLGEICDDKQQLCFALTYEREGNDLQARGLYLDEPAWRARVFATSCQSSTRCIRDECAGRMHFSVVPAKARTQ